MNLAFYISIRWVERKFGDASKQLHTSECNYIQIMLFQKKKIFDLRCTAQNWRTHTKVTLQTHIKQMQSINLLKEVFVSVIDVAPLLAKLIILCISSKFWELVRILGALCNVQPIIEMMAREIQVESTTVTKNVESLSSATATTLLMMRWSVRSPKCNAPSDGNRKPFCRCSEF